MGFEKPGTRGISMSYRAGDLDPTLSLGAGSFAIDFTQLGQRLGTK